MGYNFRYPVILLDLEMSGLNPDKHQILQVSALKCDPKNLKVLGTYDRLCGTDNVSEADFRALEVNKLGDYVRSEGFRLNSPPQSIIKEFLGWLPEKCIILGYNLQLDLLFINKLLKDESYFVFSRKIDLSDLIEFYYSLSNTKGKRGLKDVSEMFNISTNLAHTALGDCYMGLELLKILLNKYNIAKD